MGDNRLQSFLRLHKVLFNFHGQCYRCGIGSINLRQDRTTADGQIWRCSNRKCSVKIPIRRHSFFSGSHLSFSQVVKLIYYWTYQYPQHIVLHETGFSNKTVIDFYNFCREVCVVILENHSEPIGGPGRIVEIDESKFGKRKFNRGKKVDGVWVFGGIERDSDPPRCFFESVTDRSAETLIPIIKRWILPGTTIYSDCWRSYSTLVSEGYIHSTVNHSVEFKSETGTYTNNIESRWHAVKKSLPRFGTRKDLYNSYFAEYCIRRKFIDGSSDKFLQVLELIGRVYKPPEPEPAAQKPDELLSAPSAPPTRHAAAIVDIANFDLDFQLSDVDSDCNDMDTSGDMFL